MQIQANKKGQMQLIQNLSSVLIVVAVAAVTGVVVSILVGDLQETQDTSFTTTVTNESNRTALTTNASYLLTSDASTTQRIGYSLNTDTFDARNATTGCQAGSGCERVTNGNFTLFSNGTILMITTQYNGTRLNFSYSFTATQLDAVHNVSGSAEVFYSNLANQWTLLGTIIGLTLIIAAVIAAFGFRGRGNL